MCTVSICVFSLISDLCFSFCQSTIDINTHTNPFTQNESHRNIIVMIFTSTPLIVWHVSIFRAEFWLISPDVLQFSTFPSRILTFSIYVSLTTNRPRSLLYPYFGFPSTKLHRFPPSSLSINLNLLISLRLSLVSFDF